MTTQWKCYQQVFRDGWVKSLDADTNLLISDTMTPGLHLRFYKTSKNIVFYLGYMVKGTRKRKNIQIGRYGEFTIKDVRDRATTLRQQIASGLDPMLELIKENKKAEEEKIVRIKVSDLINLYLDTHCKIHKKAKTIQTETGWFEHYIKPVIGQMYMADLNIRTITELYNRAAKTSFTTANHALSLLSAFWSWTERQGYIDINTNPCKHIEKSKDKVKEVKTINPSEYKKLFAAIEDGFTESPYSPRMFRALKLLMLTGCRTNEITRLRKANVNLQERFIYLDQSKNDVEKMPIGLPVVEEFRKALEESPADSDMLFPATRGGDDAVLDLRKAHKWALERAGLRHMRKHDFRHSFISIGTDLVGASIQAVQKTIGHKKVSTTERYSHLKDKTRLDTADAITAAIMG